MRHDHVTVSSVTSAVREWAGAMMVDCRATIDVRDDQGCPRLDDVGTAATLKAVTAPP